MSVARRLASLVQRAGARATCWLTALCVLLLTSPTLARLGGGQGFSGGGGGGGGFGGGGGSGFSGGGGSGGGDGGDLILLIYLIIEYPLISLPLIAIFVGYHIYRYKNRPPSGSVGGGSSAVFTRQRALRVQKAWDVLREQDQNFSVALFRDFVYTLYAKLHVARGDGSLDRYKPYVSKPAQVTLSRIVGNVPVNQVKDVIVGGMSVMSVVRPEGPVVTATIRFESNYTECFEGKEHSFYTVEMWHLSRKTHLLSPEPQAITRIGCPACGSALEFDAEGACQHCGRQVEPGTQHWQVRGIQVLQRQTRGPILTSDVPEVGTERPTIKAPDLKEQHDRLLAENPGLDWDKVHARFTTIFMELQTAWTEQDWQRARPYETDSLFQNHLFWIRQYQQQKLRNVLEQIQFERMVPVKVRSDRFYDAITCRVYASVIDYTVDEHGERVCGNKTHPRRFSEYWTFIRGRGAKPNPHDARNCPSCGAPLKISMAGVCEYCDSKVTSGEFDWVLSTIEQDETYAG